MRPLTKIEEKEALVRKIKKELNELRKAKSDLGEIPLEKPIRHGWYRHLVLRADVARRKDAIIYQEILDRCGSIVWGSDKNRADKNWEHYHEYGSCYQWEGFSSLEQQEFKKLSSKAQCHFVEYESYWSPWLGSVKRYFCLVPSYCFEIGYSKAFITHRKVMSSELNQRIDELENRLLGNDLYAYSEDRVSTYFKLEKRYINKKGRKHVKQVLKNYNEEQLDRIMGRAFWNCF